MKITNFGDNTFLVSNSSSSSYDNSGGLLPPGTNTIQEAIDALLGGLSGIFLTVIGGGKGTVQALGTLGATETIDLANGNLFWGTLDQDCTITTTGWTNLKDCQITVELIQDGTGGWTPTFSGVTWIGGTPAWDTTPGDVSHVVLLSRDGGTTIYGAVAGGAGGTPTPLLVVQEADGSPAVAATEIDFPDGSLTVAGTVATPHLIGSRGGARQELQTVAASGAALTLDLSLYNSFDITLTANCTLTFSNPPPSGVDAHWTLVLRQGGVGSFTVTWPGTVDWQDTDGTSGGPAPTLHTAVGAQNGIEISTTDGGTSYGGTPAASGSSGTPATTVESETTFGITPAVGTDTEYARQDHTHGSPANPVSATALAALGVVGAIVMTPGIVDPPEPVWTPAGDDYVYAPLG